MKHDAYKSLHDHLRGRGWVLGKAGWIHPSHKDLAPIDDVIARAFIRRRNDTLDTNANTDAELIEWAGRAKVRLGIAA